MPASARLAVTAVVAFASLANPGAVCASRIIYLAEQDFAFVPELYLVDIDVPGVPTKLNKPMTPLSFGVSRFSISPDGNQVLFFADQTAAEDIDLYLADLAAIGSWTRLGDLPAGHTELFGRFSPDGTRIAFTASDEFFADTQLYLVDLANPRAAVRLNPPLVTHGAVSHSGFAFTPDGLSIVYVAAQDQQIFELYVVALDRPGVARKLNAPGGSVGDSWHGRFRITPDGTQVVFSAVWENAGTRELHRASLTEPGSPVTLNAPLQPDGDIADFALSPDGRWVAYLADQERDWIVEAYLVALEAPGVASRINRPVDDGAWLLQFTPDSQAVIYAADEERGPERRDLYLRPVAPLTEAIRLNAPLGPDESIVRYALSADGARVAYVVEPAGGLATDVWVVELAAPQAATRLNAPIPDGVLEFLPPQFSPDGDGVAFIAVESLDVSDQELFYASTAEPGVSVRVNAAMPPGAMVIPIEGSFAFLPAGAPPTAPAPPQAVPPQSPSGDTSSGGGAVSLLSLFAFYAGRWFCRRRASAPAATAPRGRPLRGLIEFIRKVVPGRSNDRSMAWTRYLMLRRANPSADARASRGPSAANSPA